MRLAFAGSDRSGLTDIYIADLKDGVAQGIRRELYHDRQPDWSPDGKHIVFSSDRWQGGRKGFYNLFLYDIESDAILALSRGRHNDAGPRYGPDGALNVCDWYTPVTGPAHSSQRDDRRARVSGRIFRIMPKGAKPQQMPQIHGAPLGQLLDILKRPEYRYRYWAKRELRDRDPAKTKAALDAWVAKLAPTAPRHRCL